MPETLEATAFLLSRLQAVMTRVWDPAEASTGAGATASGAASPFAVAASAVAAAENDTGTAQGTLGKAAVGGLSGVEYGVSGAPVGTEDDDNNALADTFVGSTRLARKWDWVRCSHAPVNPALAGGGGSGGAGGRWGGGRDGGGGAQSVVPPVAIDPAFCHRTLRPGRPGPEGCSLEQVRSV